MFFDFFLFFIGETQKTMVGLAQQITDPPLTWHALYWAITLGLSGVAVKLYKDLRQENKERMDLLERVLKTLDSTNDALRAIEKRLSEEASDKELVRQLNEMRAEVKEVKQVVSQRKIVGSKDSD